MRTIIKYFGVTLSLLILVSALSCGKKTVSECQSKKIELLLEDIFRKKEYFPGGSFQLYDPQNSSKHTLPDSYKSIGYLYSPNIKIPDKEFYLHRNVDTANNIPDSAKLNVINDPSTINHIGTFSVAVVLLEVNEDTTKLKVEVEHLVGRIADIQGIITYSYDGKNCKWNVLDSTITYY
ncbi:MAG: hypothetical protein NTY74_06155 [Ignavibacteriae bacterium]|nr:hypothetical protein [Ignavibacteriota bacterium]